MERGARQVPPALCWPGSCVRMVAIILRSQRRTPLQPRPAMGLRSTQLFIVPVATMHLRPVVTTRSINRHAPAFGPLSCAPRRLATRVSRTFLPKAHSVFLQHVGLPPQPTTKIRLTLPFDGGILSKYFQRRVSHGWERVGAFPGCAHETEGEHRWLLGVGRKLR
jgi:hypothetical protein